MPLYSVLVQAFKARPMLVQCKQWLNIWILRCWQLTVYMIDFIISSSCHKSQKELKLKLHPLQHCINLWNLGGVDTKQNTNDAEVISTDHNVVVCDSTATTNKKRNCCINQPLAVCHASFRTSHLLLCVMKITNNTYLVNNSPLLNKVRSPSIAQQNCLSHSNLIVVLLLPATQL